jgi:hypothetical protein
VTVPRVQAAAPLTDISTWLRGSGLEIVLLVLGGLLLSLWVPESRSWALSCGFVEKPPGRAMIAA